MIIWADAMAVPAVPRPAKHELGQTLMLVARDFQARLDEVCARFAATRPTAVNLFWAIDRFCGFV